MVDDAPNLNFLRAHALAETLYRAGVEWCCIAPGSRSAPLAWAFEDHPHIKTVVHFDERGLAFHAMGIAAATNKPAVFVCTSGTAVANALPAVIEASHSRIPLLLLTADRPPEMHGLGMNQTIEQHGIYGSFVRSEDELPFHQEGVDATTSVLNKALEAVRISRRAVAGPVHLNVPLREPLEPSTDPTFDAAPHVKAVTAWFDSLDFNTEPAEAPFQLPEDLADILTSTTRGVVMLGQLRTDAQRDAVRRVVEHLDWPVYADITSGFRTGGLKQTIPFYSRLTLGGDLKAIEADALLHLGGAVVAKNLPIPLAENAPFIRVANAPHQLNPWKRATHLLDTSITAFADAASNITPTNVDDAWRAQLQMRSDAVAGAISNYLTEEKGEYGKGGIRARSEVATARIVMESAPENAIIFLGNSMPIRDADWYAEAGPETRYIAANRGTSGIDGNTATALGHARATGRPLVIFIGDLTFLHDLNSFPLAANLGAPCITVVVNNAGGGIFSMLPIAEHTKHFDQLFGIPFNACLQHIVPCIGFDLAWPDNENDLAQLLQNPAEWAEPAIIEWNAAFREDNAILHHALNTAIRYALDAL